MTYAAKHTVSPPVGQLGTSEPEISSAGEDADPYAAVPYDRDCPDFSETDFPTPAGDPDGLDRDSDGIACES